MLSRIVRESAVLVQEGRLQQFVRPHRREAPIVAAVMYDSQGLTR